MSDRKVPARSPFVQLESLEQRRLLAASPVYAPHSNVRGESLQEYAADFWKGVFGTPVYAPDGKTIINPQFDAPLNDGDIVNVNHAYPTLNGKAFNLAGSFFGSEINRTVSVPTGTPIFVPILNDVWSNPDTADGPNFDTVPGHYTPAQLATLAVQQTNLATDLSASLDGKPITDIADHREPSLRFTYTEPAQFGVHQVFFGETLTDPVPAAADGYYIMLKPLSPGQHVLHFTGGFPASAPPLLGAFTADVTYTINVVPAGKYKPSPATIHGNASNFSSQPIRDHNLLADLN